MSRRFKTDFFIVSAVVCLIASAVCIGYGQQEYALVSVLDQSSRQAGVMGEQGFSDNFVALVFGICALALFISAFEEIRQLRREEKSQIWMQVTPKRK